MTPRADSTLRDAVVREVTIDASPETVFEFFVDPEKMTRWKGRTATLDPTPGGTYRVEINDRDIASGAYVEIDRPRRIVFTWGWDNPQSPVRPGTSTVEVTLEPAGEGTLVRLVHRDLPEDQRDLHGEGWDHFMPRLQAAAAGRDPGPDPMESAADN